MNELYLIEKIKLSNDNEAFKELLNCYSKMIYKIINSFNLKQGDYLLDVDEMYQEASIALYQACFKYDEKKNVKFSSFLYLLVQRRLITYFRTAIKRQGQGLYSLDALKENNYHSYASVVLVEESPVAFHNESTFKKHLNDYLNSLNEFDQRIIYLRQENYSYKQIASTLGVSTKKIDNRLQAMKLNFKRYLFKKENI